MSNEWTHIDKGLPPCDSETVYVGKNAGGFYRCFNEFVEMDAKVGYRNACLYASDVGTDNVMTDLVRWKRLEMPA